MRTGRFHDGVVTTADIPTAFIVTLSPSGLEATPLNLAAFQPQTITMPEPDATEITPETIRDFILLGKVWGVQGDMRLFEPGGDILSDVIRFVNVANGGPVILFVSGEQGNVIC